MGSVEAFDQQVMCINP